MALKFAPPKAQVSVRLELDHDVHETLQRSVDEHNRTYGDKALTLDKAAAEILNAAVRKSSRPPSRRARS